MLLCLVSLVGRHFTSYILHGVRKTHGILLARSYCHLQCVMYLRAYSSCHGTATVSTRYDTLKTLPVLYCTTYTHLAVGHKYSQVLASSCEYSVFFGFAKDVLL